MSEEASNPAENDDGGVRSDHQLHGQGLERSSPVNHKLLEKSLRNTQ
jgi:hypothetical protein